MIIPAAGTVTLEVRGDLRDGAGNNYTAGTVQVNVTSFVGRGQQSQSTVTSASATGKSLTIGSATVTFSNTGGFLGQTVTPNSNVRLGSFTVSNSNYEDIRVTNLAVGLVVTAGQMALSNISNLRVTDSATIVAQPTAANNFTMDITVPMNSTKVFEVTADLGASASSTAAVLTNATSSYRGINSGVSTTAAATGVSMTANTATLVAADVTKLSSSAPSQLVVSGTVMPTVTYNVKASTAPVTITELTFDIATSTDAITALKVGGVTKTIIALTGNVVTGLNIVVPAGASGLNIPVDVTFGNVNTNGGIASQSAAVDTITLTAVKYTSGNTSATLTTASTTLVSNAMQLVASKPSLTVDGVQKTGLILGSENKIGEVAVFADTKGDIKLNKLIFNIGYSGFSTGPALSAVRIADGSTTISGTTATTTTSTSSPVVTVDFGDTATTSDGYSIPAGTSKTFSLFATNTGGVVSSGATAAVSAQVQGTTNFLWDDVTGGGLGLTAANLFNFPTQSYSVRQ